jgi:hypothetical protein
MMVIGKVPLVPSIIYYSGGRRAVVLLEGKGNRYTRHRLTAYTNIVRLHAYSQYIHVHQYLRLLSSSEHTQTILKTTDKF